MGNLKTKPHHTKVLFNRFPNGLSHLRALSIESKGRKLCITQVFPGTLEVKGIKDLVAGSCRSTAANIGFAF